MERLLASLPSPRASSQSGLGTLVESVPGTAESFKAASPLKTPHPCHRLERQLKVTKIKTGIRCP